MSRKARVESPGSRLSTQERLVLTAFANGMTSEEVAAAMSLSVGTVRTYVIRLRNRLGAKTIGHAIHLAHQKGVLG